MKSAITTEITIRLTDKMAEWLKTNRQWEIVDIKEYEWECHTTPCDLIKYGPDDNRPTPLTDDETFMLDIDVIECIEAIKPSYMKIVKLRPDIIVNPI